VHGYASDSRQANRAKLRFQINRWGREWDSTHETVKYAIESVMDDLERLSTEHPKAVGHSTIAQACQKSWLDDIGSAYSESVDVYVIFSDFEVMSTWILQQPPEMFHNYTIEWSLSQAVRDEMNIALSVQAVRDARRRAEIFATAAGMSITRLETLEDPPSADTERGRLRLPTDSSSGMIEDNPPGEILIAPKIIRTEVHIVAHFTAEPESENSEHTQSAQFAQTHRHGASFFES